MHSCILCLYHMYTLPHTCCNTTCIVQSIESCTMLVRRSIQAVWVWYTITNAACILVVFPSCIDPVLQWYTIAHTDRNTGGIQSCITHMYTPVLRCIQHVCPLYTTVRGPRITGGTGQGATGMRGGCGCSVSPGLQRRTPCHGAVVLRRRGVRRRR